MKRLERTQFEGRSNEVTAADGGCRVPVASVTLWPAGAEFLRYALPK